MANETWKCPKCGVENEAENNFCGECGTRKPETEIGINQINRNPNPIASATVKQAERTVPEQSGWDNVDNIQEDDATYEKMGMMDAVKKCFSNYATFSGRAHRREYWFFTLFNFLIEFTIGLLTAISGIAALGYLSNLYSLVILVPGWAVFIRRLHDVGKSGWNWLWLFVPVIGWILVLVWLVKDSQDGSNQYGSYPK